MKLIFLNGFPGRPGRERIVLAIGIVAPCFGMLAGWLIDWKKWDADGGVIQSPLARGVFLSSLVVTIICVGLYFSFRHIARKHEQKPID
jgi:hypothetical protein